MKRVLLISANQEKLPDPVPPLGVAWVAASVRRSGHDVRILDLCFSEDFRADLANVLRSYRPEVVAHSIRNVDNVAFPEAVSYLDFHREVASLCRCHAPNATFFVGGSGFSLFPSELMDVLRPHYGVVGEGESIFPRMVDEIDRHGRVIGPYADTSGIIRATRLEDLNAVASPALDLLDVARYFAEGGSINVQSKRGCSFHCVYCNYPLLEGAAVRLRDPVIVAEDIDVVRSRHGVDSFFFVDNVFNHPPDHASAVSEELLRRDLKVRWTAQVSPAGLSRDLLALMRRSGCSSIDLGVDCLSDDQLQRMGKSFEVDQALRVTSWCHELGIRFNLSLIFGGPGETWKTVEETVGNALRSRANSVIAIMGVRVFLQTRLAMLASDEGRLSQDQIGARPVFYLSDEIKEGIVDYLRELASVCRNWMVPGIGKNLNPRFFRRLRSRGAKGPLWELLDPIESPTEHGWFDPPTRAKSES